MINFHSDEKTKTSIPKNSQKHIIKEEIVDFKNDSINIDSLDSSKGILKLFVSIEGVKVKNNNEDEPNFYTIKLKDIPVKNEFQDLSFQIVNNIVINLSIKVKNIIGGGFASRMNMFKKKNESNETKNIIKTGAGISIKDKLKILNEKKKDIFPPEPQNKPVPKKIVFPADLSNKLMHSHGTINNYQIYQEDEKKDNDNNKEKENKQEKEKNNEINNEQNIDEDKKVEKDNIIPNNDNKEEKSEIEQDLKEENKEEPQKENEEENKEEEKQEEKQEENKEENKEENNEIEQEVKEEENEEEKQEENKEEEEEKEVKPEEQEEKPKENREEEQEKQEEKPEEEQEEKPEEKPEENEENQEEEQKNINDEKVEEQLEREKNEIEAESSEKKEEDNDKNKEEKNNEENIDEEKENYPQDEKELEQEENKEQIEENNKEQLNEEEIEENKNEQETDNNNAQENQDENKEVEQNEKDVEKEDIENIKNTEEEENKNEEENKDAENNEEKENETENKEDQENQIQEKEETNNDEKIIEQGEEDEEKEKEEEDNNEEEQNEENNENEEENENNDNLIKNDLEDIENNINRENESEGNLNKNKKEKSGIKRSFCFTRAKAKEIEKREEEEEKKKEKEENDEEEEKKKEEEEEKKKEEEERKKEEEEKRKEKEEKDKEKEKEKKKEEEEFKKQKTFDSKRASCILPSSDFKNIIGNKDNQVSPQKKAPPKKLDVNKFKRLIGERLIGQVIKRPNELMKKKDETQTPSSTQNSQGNTYSPPTPQEKKETPINTLKFTKVETDALENEMKKYNENEKSSKRKSKPTSPNPKERKSLKKDNVADDFGFEVLDSYLDDTIQNSTENTSTDNLINELFLDSMNYEDYLSDLKQQGKKEDPREAFCEGFFIASFPKKKGQVIENSAEKLPASCGHPECSKLPSMKPEIIMRYPLKDTKSLELNNLAATICFPTGIKLCYSETDNPGQIKDYVTQITNQKGERYYMRTFHFYHKMNNIEFAKEYEIHPLKHHLMKFGDEYIILSEDQFTDDIVNNIQKNLEFCQGLGFRDIVYIPYCICLISKYPYIKELENCLNTIYRIMTKDPENLSFEINELIMYLIHSIPIPIKNMKKRFYIPYNEMKMELLCPKVDDVSIMNSTFTSLFDYLSIDNIILVFRLLLSEKKILFIHDDYTELTNITNSFISLLYPFKWVHTYIPIMSDQMLKYLETFLPFLNGIHRSLMKFVEDIFQEGEIEESDEIFLVYINKGDLGDITLSSSLKKGKVKFSKYVQNNVLPLPFEKDLKAKLKSIESQRKSLKRESKSNYNETHALLENKMRDAFINIFVKMFHDYEKYVGIIDDDVVFNKVLFMNNINKDEKFYDEFIDCQLFQQFTQNLLKDNFSYFNKKIKEAKEKEKDKKKKDKKADKENRLSSLKQEYLYIARPDYLGIKENDKNIIETTLKDNYKIDKKESPEIKNRIPEKINEIDPEKYINSNCLIYLTPEKKDAKEDENKSNLLTLKGDNKSILKKSTLLSSGELTEKQIDRIKDDIKDLVAKIFKSEIKNADDKALKAEVFRNLETSFGRAFFVSLISNNSTNIISLQDNSFSLLKDIINNILASIVTMAETDQLIEEVVILIRSTKYFESEGKKKDGDKKKSSKKKHETLFKNMKKKFQTVNAINQKNFWQKWYELDLKKIEQEEEPDDETKSRLIENICKEMFEFDISKTIIKNVCDNINKTSFEEGSEIFELTKKKYIDLISHTNYISQAK